MEQEQTGGKWVYDLLGWLDLHRKAVIGAAIGIIALLMIVYAISWKSKQSYFRANSALYTLLSRWDESLSPSPASLIEFAEKNDHLPAAQRALLFAAAKYFIDDNYEQAQQLFQQYLETYRNTDWAPIAALGVASSLHALSKTNEAEAAYKGIIQQYATHPAAVQARLNLALIYEDTGRLKDALAIYDELSNPNLFGRGAFEAAQAKQRLLREHPELAQKSQSEPQAAEKAAAQTATNLSAEQPINATTTNQTDHATTSSSQAINSAARLKSLSEPSITNSSPQPELIPTNRSGSN